MRKWQITSYELDLSQEKGIQTRRPPWSKKEGGCEYRGIRTKRYTYVRNLDGPWLLFDNQRDPYQKSNLCHLKEYNDLRSKLDKKRNDLLEARGDLFQPGRYYLEEFGYNINERSGAMPYK